MISILRLPFLYIFTVSDDVTWDSPMISIASSLELNIAIMASVSSWPAHAKRKLTCLQCIPTLRGLLSRMFPSFSNSENYFGHTSTHHGGETFGEGFMEDLEGFRQPSSSRGSANTTTLLNPTCFNVTAKLDD